MDKYTIYCSEEQTKTEPELFINEFIGSYVDDSHKQECIRSKFMNGYCYYFAHMLKLAFNRGTVCWTAPFGHFVWVDDSFDVKPDYTKIKVYDIEGIYDIKKHDVFYLIPEKYVGEHIKDFLHIPSKIKNKGATKDDLISIIQKYCTDYNEVYYKEIENSYG